MAANRKMLLSARYPASLFFALAASFSNIIQGATLENTTDLAALSLEELIQVEITSVSKRPQKLTDAAAAIYVITQEDIRRSGVTSIPEALRLAPNLTVARVDSSQYAISARGFNTTTANNLLVLIDGRSVYTPLYAGVFWDVQDLLLDDIERIEVISGPGATLWGANAVNGVINVISRKAKYTQGTLVRGMIGTAERGQGIRYGGSLSENASYRVYAKNFDRDNTVRSNGTSVSDDWQMSRGGFRMDWGDDEGGFTLQGDVYRGNIDQAGALADKDLGGGNLLARLTKTLAGGSNFQAQVYYDHTKRVYPESFAESLDTLDIDLQHRFKWSKRHDIIWGGGYRFSRDRLTNSTSLAFLPAHKDLRLVNFFIQDDITLIPNRLDLTVGSKFENNSYTGFEFQPSARLAWKPHTQHLLWAAASRAVRDPSRIDRDFFIPATAATPLQGGPNFEAEIVHAYEMGYRTQPSRALTASVSLFYNVLDNLRSVEPHGQTGFYILSNKMKGETHGVEMWAEYQVTKNWSLRPGYTYLEKDLSFTDDSRTSFATSISGNDPTHQFSLRSLLNLNKRWELDFNLRHIGKLPSPVVPAYTTLDIRLGWKPKTDLEISLVGQNLLDKRHPEFGSPATRSEIERSFFVRAIWKF